MKLFFCKIWWEYVMARRDLYFLSWSPFCTEQSVLSTLTEESAAVSSMMLLLLFKAFQKLEMSNCVCSFFVLSTSWFDWIYEGRNFWGAVWAEVFQRRYLTWKVSQPLLESISLPSPPQDRWFRSNAEVRNQVNFHEHIINIFDFHFHDP